MRCTACHRKLTATPYTVGRYAYGPVCFERMFPATPQPRGEKVPVVIDDKTPDLFEPCFFDVAGESDRLEMMAKQA